MNVQSSKKILFNKSSLLSLKAELMKKQEEVYEKKQLHEHRIENHKPPPAKVNASDKPGNKEKKSFKDGLKAVDTEEVEACRKSKLALEKKAELYDHLADGTGNSQLADRFLVDFNTKKHEEAKELVRHAPEADESEDASGDNGNDADEWIEFTDCLGRTRKCHKSDLDMFKRRDKDLMRTMFNDSGREGSSADQVPPESQEPEKEKPLLVRTTNDYLQSLREKWEEKERELLAKDKDIHYQDLLFDEARIHGVGYYAFSTDEVERQKQMEELIKERKATLDAQKQAEELRKKREEIMAARVKAARARQRMRAGLPPEEDEPTDTTKDFTAHLLEFLTQQRDEADTKAKEEEKKKKEEVEKERQKLREAYIREWDLGKAGVHEKIKKFREMTQEEYVDQQRDKRIDEFAPPKASSSKIEHNRKSNYAFDNHGKVLDTPEAKTWSDVRPQLPPQPLPHIGDLHEQKGLYFSSKKQNDDESISSANTEVRATPPNITRKEVKYKNFVKSQEPAPIVNELSDDEGAAERSAPDGCWNQPSGAEVAPPPTYDYYGPVAKRQKFTKPFESDIREAYAQGAKSLETQPKCRQISKDYDFMFD